MKKNSFLLLGFFIASKSFSVNSIDSVRNEAKIDLQNAISQLTELRRSIEKEKIPLASKLSELERKARKMRAELDNNLRLRDNREASLLELENEVKKNESDLNNSLNLLNDYISSWHSANPAAEQTLWSKDLSAILKSQKNSSGFDSFKSAFLGMSLSVKSIQATAGAILFQGDAIVRPEGVRIPGSFLSIGPTIFFSGQKGYSGFLERDLVDIQSQSSKLSANSVLKTKVPRVKKLSPKTSNVITQAFTSKSNQNEYLILPLDPTLGKASVMEKGELNLLEELKKGGIWIYPILFFAILSIIIALIKGYQILQINFPKSTVSFEKIYNEPFELLKKTVKSYQGANSEILEEILYENIIDTQIKLEKALPLIAVTAATAPLLGLLGTVTGMIDVFRQITNFANPENSELARGISEALVTTKFGLVTAIPALIAHALLTRRVQGIISKMEGFSAQLLRLKQENKSPNIIDSIHEPNS